MGLPIRIETRTGDTPASKRQRQRRDPPDILLTTPEQLALILASPDAPYLFGALKRVVLDELHSLVISKRGDLLSLGLARLFALAPDAHHASASRRRWPSPTICAAIWCRSAAAAARSPISCIAEAGAPPDVTMLDTAERLPWAGHSAHARDRRNLRADQAPQDHAGLRQYPQPGREHLPGALAHQRRRAGDRAASRLARRGAAPQGRGRDGGRPAARGGLHLLARSRHRLGRRRSRHQCRRAEGRVAPAAAHRPRQSPHGRAVEGRAGAGQPLRGAGMPRRARRRRRERAGHAAAAHRRARRAGAARARLGLRRAVPRRRALRRGDDAPRPMPALTRADFDAVLDFVATGGYALKAYERFAKIRQGKDGRWRVSASEDRAALPHECRHHRRGRHAEGAAGALARRAR